LAPVPLEDTQREPQIAPRFAYEFVDSGRQVARLDCPAVTSKSPTLSHTLNIKRLAVSIEDSDFVLLAAWTQCDLSSCDF
jgi:hypothetical protein